MMETVEQKNTAPKVDLRACAILLDVDGTLLDIAPTPDSVNVPESLIHDITALHERTGGALAFVSGRRISDIDKLFAPLKTSAVGCHGAEIRYGDGRIEHGEALPVDIKKCFAQLAGDDARILVEDKAYSVALHYRLAPEKKAELWDAAQLCLANFPAAGLALLDGKFVVELKRAGINKGTGIAALMARVPFASRKPIFAGDDHTDEYALAALPVFNGMGISVGRKLPGASVEMKKPGDVRAWIAQLARDV